MKYRLILPALLSLLIISCSTTPQEEWIPLFNGHDLDGWVIKIKGSPLGENYRNTFRVEEGVMKVDYSEYDSFRLEFGHIFYHEPFRANHTRLNSGRLSCLTLEEKTKEGDNVSKEHGIF